MKAYRFESREETKWQWGFWALWWFTYSSMIIIGVLMDSTLLSWVSCCFCILIIWIINFDIVGYKIKKKTLKEKKP